MMSIRLHLINSVDWYGTSPAMNLLLHDVLIEWNYVVFPKLAILSLKILVYLCLSFSFYQVQFIVIDNWLSGWS